MAEQRKWELPVCPKCGRDFVKWSVGKHASVCDASMVTVEVVPLIDLEEANQVAANWRRRAKAAHTSRKVAWNKLNQAVEALRQIATDTDAAQGWKFQKAARSTLAEIEEEKGG